jgi:hypothetical protein
MAAPSFFAIDPRVPSQAYICDTTALKIYKMSPGLASASAIVTTNVSSAKGIVVTPVGNFIVAGANGRFAKYNSSGTLLWSYASPTGDVSDGSVYNLISGIAMDSNGTIIILDGVNNGLKYFAPISSLNSVSATASGTTVTLSWSGTPTSNDYVGTTIRRSLSGYPITPTSDTAVSINVMGNSYSDTGLSTGTYYYTMFTKTDDGYFGQAVTASAVVSFAAPAAPATASVVASADSVVLIWEGVSGADSYTLRKGSGSYPITISDGAAVTSGVTATSYTDLGLTEGTYYYSIFSVNGSGNSAAVTVSGVIAVPTVSNVVATASGTSVALSWTNPGYNFQSVVVAVSTSNVPVSPSEGVVVTDNTASQSVTYFPSSDATYYFSIFTRGTTGATSAAVTTNLAMTGFPPAAPTSFNGTVSGNQVSLGWINPGSDFVSVMIRRDTTGFPVSVSAGVVVTNNFIGTTFSETQSDGTFFYGIFAQDSLGNFSRVATAAVTVDTTSPGTVSGLELTPSTSSVLVSWTTPTADDFAGVTIRRSSLTSSTPVTISTGNRGRSLTDSGLTGDTYYYSIFTADDLGNLSESVTENTRIEIGLPTSLVATNSGSTVTVSWVNPTDVGFSSISLVRKTGSVPLTPTDGTVIISGSTATQNTETGVSDNVYYYGVFAIDTSSHYQVATATVRVDTTSPGTVSGLVLTPSTSSVLVSWTTPTADDFAGVTIRRSSLTNLTPVTISTGNRGRSLTDSGLTGDTYYYSIFTADDLGNLSESVTENTRIEIGLPTSVVATNSASTVSVSWVNPTDVGFSSVSLVRKTGSVPLTPTDGTVILSGSTATQNTETGVSDNVYYYGVFAIDTSRHYQVATTSLAVDTTAPQSPTSLNAVVSGNQVQLSWELPTAPDFDHLVLYRDDAVCAVSTPSTTYTDTELTTGAYLYRLKSVDRNGNSSAGVTINATVDITAPQNPSSATGSVSGTSVVLTWTNPSDSDFAGTTIYQSTSNIGSAGTIVTANSHLERLALSGFDSKTYYFLFVARDTNGNISSGNLLAITVPLNEPFLDETKEVASGELTLTTSSNIPLENPVFGNGGAATINVETTRVTSGTELGINNGSGVMVLATPNAVWMDTGSVTVGKSGVGMVIQSGGVVDIQGTLTLGKELGSSGNYVLSGGSFKVDTLEIGGAGHGAVDWTGGTIQATNVMGNLTNNGGVLVVKSNAPMTITGNYSQGASSRYRLTLQSGVSIRSAGNRIKTRSAASTALLRVTGILGLSGTLEIEIDDYIPTIGDQFKVIEAASTSAQFDTIITPALPATMQWDIASLYSTGEIHINGSSSDAMTGKPYNYPNPFRMGVASTIIGYLLNRDLDVTIRVYTSSGQEIYQAAMPRGTEGGKTGYNRIVIGKQATGTIWPAGVYHYMLIGEGKAIGKGRLVVLP